MLEAGTRGGPVPLEATSLQLKFLMDRVTGKTPHMETLKAISSTAPVAIRLHGWHALWSLLELDKIAKKYLLCDASDFIHRLIICYVDRNPPAALMHACQSSPFDANMAMAALKAFKDEMPIWMRAYFDKTRYDANRPPGSKMYFTPGAHNIGPHFSDALGLEAFIAYTRALESGTINVVVSYDKDRRLITNVVHDWEMVADHFIKALKVPQHTRSWLLSHDEDDGASDWSHASFSPGRSPPPSSSPLRSPPPID